MMKDKKKILTIGVIIIAIAAVVALVLYLRPVHVIKHVELVSEDNETISMDLDVTWHKSILNRKTLDGEILYNQTKYRDGFKTDDQVDFFEKLNGTEKMYIFSAEGNTIGAILDNSIMIISANNDFSQLSVIINCKGESKFYTTKK